MLFFYLPQVLTGIIAFVSVFSFFRLQEIKNLLIGDGKGAIDRFDEPIYKELKKSQKQRIVDAVYRENFHEIFEVFIDTT